MADWLVDIGHTRIKWATTGADGRLEGIESCPIDQPTRFERRLADDGGAQVWMSAQSDRATIETISARAKANGRAVHPVETGSLELPVAPAYTGLGSDRWLAIQWPWLQSRQALCVVDCGTALTVDVIDDRGNHRGGWIMAGKRSALEGLLARARKLPHPDRPPGDAEQPARATDQAIGAGGLLQMAGSIERAVDAAGEYLGKNPAIWVTGGDASAIIALTRIHARIDEHLVLRGLAMAARQ